MPKTTAEIENGENTIEVELLPCPFCGMDAVTDHYDDRGGDHGDVFYIRCEDGCVSLSDSTPEEVCDTWNTRDDKLLVKQAHKFTQKTRMAYHSTTFALGMLNEMKEAADWMVAVIKPDGDGEYVGHSCPSLELKSMSGDLKRLGWVRKDKDEQQK
tara:strand:+ start:55 stop:522 length:468 start_codon:yes stop_codon:yes gene_type:complete